MKCTQGTCLLLPPFTLPAAQRRTTTYAMIWETVPSALVSSARSTPSPTGIASRLSCSYNSIHLRTSHPHHHINVELKHAPSPTKTRRSRGSQRRFSAPGRSAQRRRCLQTYHLHGRRLAGRRQGQWEVRKDGEEEVACTGADCDVVDDFGVSAAPRKRDKSASSRCRKCGSLKGEDGAFAGACSTPSLE